MLLQRDLKTLAGVNEPGHGWLWDEPSMPPGKRNSGTGPGRRFQAPPSPARFRGLFSSSQATGTAAFLRRILRYETRPPPTPQIRPASTIVPGSGTATGVGV